MSPRAAAGAGSSGEDGFLRTFPAIVKVECLGIAVRLLGLTAETCKSASDAFYRMLQRFQASLWWQTVQFAVWFAPFLKGRVLILLDLKPFPI